MPLVLALITNPSSQMDLCNVTRQDLNVPAFWLVYESKNKKNSIELPVLGEKKINLSADHL